MNKLTQVSIEWGVAGCLMAITLWLPFIGIIPFILGSLVLFFIYLLVGRLVFVWLDDWND